jgi:hypothetical protein
MIPNSSYVKEREGHIAFAVTFSCLDRADCKDIPLAISTVESAWTGGWARSWTVHYKHEVTTSWATSQTEPHCNSERMSGCSCERAFVQVPVRRLGFGI